MKEKKPHQGFFILNNAYNKLQWLERGKLLRGNAPLERQTTFSCACIGAAWWNESPLIAKYVNDVLHSLRRETASSSVCVNYKWDTSVPRVWCDTERSAFIFSSMTTERDRKLTYWSHHLINNQAFLSFYPFSVCGKIHMKQVCGDKIKNKLDTGQARPILFVTSKPQLM